jgi:hypothetical protein
MSYKEDPGAISFTPLRQSTQVMDVNAPSFIPNSMNINAPSFIPQSNKNKAAKTLQKRFRGNRERNNLTQKKQAASKIQSRLRGNRSRTGKSQKWGLPYPESRRDLNFDPELQKRIFEESMYGLNRGLEPIREDIELQSRNIKQLEKDLKEIEREEADYSSRFNLGKRADETKKERYLEYEVENIKELMDKMNKNPETYRESGLLETYKKLYGDGDEELIEERLREHRSKPEGMSFTRAKGMRNKNEELAKEEDDLQKYYNNMKTNKSMSISNKEFAEYNKEFQESKLENLDRLDLFKCKDIKAMAQADERLYLDKDFLENKIRPCRDELTKIYIDTFYSIPYVVIMPSPISIETTLRNMAKNGNFTEATSTAMIDTLITMGIMLNYEQRTLFSDPTSLYIGQPFDNWLLLSQFYRFASSGRTTVLKHMKKNPAWTSGDARRNPEYPRVTGILVDEQRTRVDINGREALEYTLNLFEETVKERKLKMPGRKEMTDNDIEKMKRYFILCLIGFNSPNISSSAPQKFWLSRYYLPDLNRIIVKNDKLYWRKMGEGDWKTSKKLKITIDKLKLIKLNLEKIEI